MNDLDRFQEICDQKFTLISLQKVQRIVSEMKKRVESHSRFPDSEDFLIIVLSDDPMLQMSVSERNGEVQYVTWTCTQMKSHEALFDGSARR